MVHYLCPPPLQASTPVLGTGVEVASERLGYLGSLEGFCVAHLFGSDYKVEPSMSLSRGDGDRGARDGVSNLLEHVGPGPHGQPE